MLIRGTEGGDVRVTDGRIAEIAPTIERQAGEEVVEADGGALLPGLHDHHLHLRARAAARSSVDLTSGALDALDVPGDDWIRATGYHESIAGPLDRWVLDAVVGDRPVRVQHRTGELWILSSAAARAVGLPDDHDGRLWRQDEWLRARVPPVELDLAAVGREAAARGVTGFTDTTPDQAAGDAEDLLAAGLPQRLHLMVPPEVDVPDHPRVTAGPHKLLLDDATLPTVDELAATIAAAPRGVAVHCVTRLQLIVFLAAGPRPGDRIEHGAVIPPELIAEVARLGLVVVTQPNFVAERGEQYRTDVDPDDLPSLYRCGSLLRAGVAVAAGTDAPFGGADPWAAMRAAVHRTLGPDERVGPAQALTLFLGAAAEPARPRTLDRGTPADLCLLRVPLDVQLRELDAANVRLTMVAGEVAATPGA
ncbi:MAG: Amidohydrolase 3 [Acidimicrobiales bacterium]|nr:Amidohydrolase 3 [Acidimicrobiales bacterium]